MKNYRLACKITWFEPNRKCLGINEVKYKKKLQDKKYWRTQKSPKNEWNKYSTQYLMSLYDGMSKRLEDCLKKEGYPINKWLTKIF